MNGHGILTKKEIIDLLDSKNNVNKRLFISPIFDENIKDASIDLRVGHHFLVPVPTKLGELDIASIHYSSDLNFRNNYKDLRIPFGRHYTLHPGKSVQIGTMEYLGIPNFLVGNVNLRASISHLPVICNTINVYPGHKGIITLNLINKADFAIKLYPGLRIASLTLYHSASCLKHPENSRYHRLVHPQVTQLHLDKDIEKIGPRVEPFIIGIVSTLASGRTTAINYLRKNRGFSYFSLSTILKEEAIRRGSLLNRNDLQRFGSEFRQEYGDDILAVKLRSDRRWLANPNPFVIVDSFKHRKEVEEFEKQDRFFLIGINAPLKTRWDMTKGLHRPNYPKTEQEFTEWDKIDRGLLPHRSKHSQETQHLLDSYVKFNIENDFDGISKFEQKVENKINKIIIKG